MPRQVEFELSRLIEKEIHFHLKVEEEKKQLMRQSDFNTVACFTTLDPKKFGYIDHDQLLKFMSKFDRQTNLKTINAVMRRLNDNEDFKISFSEMARHISPLQPGFSDKGCLTSKFKFEMADKENSDDPLAKSKFLHLLDHDGVPYNLEAKMQVLRDMEIRKKT
jgi:Ca2+-binding EF-hand superfamily protein